MCLGSQRLLPFHFQGPISKGQLAIPYWQPCQIIASVINIAENPVFMRSAFCKSSNNSEWRNLGCKSSSMNSRPSGAFKTIQFSRAFKTFSMTLLCWIMGLSELHSSFKVLLKRLRRTWAAISLFNDITIKIVSLDHSFVTKSFYSRYSCRTFVIQD